MVLAFLTVFFAIRSYRDNVAGRRLTFGRALIIGLMITAVASACYTASWELIYCKLAPNFIDKYTAYIVEKAKRSGGTESQIAAKTKEMTETKRFTRIRW